MASSWDALAEKDENELHKQRLLNVEAKPFKRITDRLSTLHGLASSRARQPPTPPPENHGDGADGTTTAPATGGAQTPPASAKPGPDMAQLKQDITLDFAAFVSNIERLQLLLTANVKQRALYTEKRGRILATELQLRESNLQLRAQLEQARAMLAQRRRFDELADQITRKPALRPRAEQATNLAKLEEEIASLEAESETYAATWRERRDQFARIMDEAMRLRRQIRDEKEENERREGMDDGDDQMDTPVGGAHADAECNQTPRPGLASGNATPRPDGGLHPRSCVDHNDAARTSRPPSTAGQATPARDSPAPSESQQSLKPLPSTAHGLSPDRSRAGSQMGSRPGSSSASRVRSGSGSRPGSRAASRAASRASSPEESPTRIASHEQEEQDPAESGGQKDVDDVEMAGAKDNEEPLAPAQDVEPGVKDDVDMVEIKHDVEVEDVQTAGQPEDMDSPLNSLPVEAEVPPQIVIEGQDGRHQDEMDTA